MFKTEDELLEALKGRLRTARDKHPIFAEGPWQALGFISEEHGELCREISHPVHGSEIDYERACDEALDLLCVTARFALGEFVHEN